MVAGAQPRIALVLGSGGIVGGAFHAGVLKALHDVWGIDGRAVQVIVGTSAGSIAGALTAAGLHPNDLFRRETNKPLSPAGHRLLAKARQHRGPKPDPQSTVGRPAAPEVLLNAAANPFRVSPGAVMAGLMPRGSASTGHVAGLVEGLFGEEWPADADLRVCAVELPTARRVVFSRRGPTKAGASPSQAVAASCAVPAVFAPVTIGDREYIDGGVHSADNLDVLGDDHFDLILVSSPMSAGPRIAADPMWSALRELTTWQTDRERKRIANCGHVEIIKPTADDLDAMGSNLLDPSRRPAVAFQAHASASAQLVNQPRPF